MTVKELIEELEVYHPDCAIEIQVESVAGKKGYATLERCTLSPRYSKNGQRGPRVFGVLNKTNPPSPTYTDLVERKLKD